MASRLLPTRRVRGLFLFLLLPFIFLDGARSEDSGGQTDDTGTEQQLLEEETNSAYAVLFPPFTITVGVVAFYVLSRYIKALPYTAVMFLIGTLMGITSALGNGTSQIAKTLDMWVTIVSIFLFGNIAKSNGLFLPQLSESSPSCSRLK